MFQEIGIQTLFCFGQPMIVISFMSRGFLKYCYVDSLTEKLKLGDNFSIIDFIHMDNFTTSNSISNLEICFTLLQKLYFNQVFL